MSASLVGSEMCIRDRLHCASRADEPLADGIGDTLEQVAEDVFCPEVFRPCLLYTSDAADDM
eukprot:11820075-Alexandrium_andersonii.AAC.1